MSDRIRRLAQGLKVRVFNSISRSLFKADRLMFGLHLVHGLHPKLFGEKEDREWEAFTGELVLDVSAAPPSSSSAVPSWVPPERAAAYTQFTAAFPALSRSLRFTQEDTHSIWAAWTRSPKPEADFPDFKQAAGAAAGEKPVSPFQRLLVVKTLRPDRAMSALHDFTLRTVGVSTLTPPSLHLGDVVRETSPDEPILFVTTAGADPSQELEDFAAKSIGLDRFKQLAMGSGQTDAALDMVTQAAREGSWVCLKNLHLVTAWLPTLEKVLKAGTPHTNFRLWLTTEPHPHFPTILLQQSLKLTYESPPGVKQNLLRTYESWGAEFIGKGSSNRAQLLFALAWYHAILCERRTYIPQGWTKYYEFSFADLRSGADIIDAACKRLEERKAMDPNHIPWNTLYGLMKFAVYGGRIDDDNDFRVLTTYLSKFFQRDMLSFGTSKPTKQIISGVDMPVQPAHSDFMVLINNAVSDSDTPALFGLSDNVDGTVQQVQAANVVSLLRRLAVSSSLSAKFDREVWRSQLRPVLTAWTAYSGANDRAILRKPAPAGRDEAKLSPVDSFVLLEGARAFELVTVVQSSLGAISSVVEGTGLLTPDIQADGMALLAGNVPSRWSRKWYGPEEPLQWLQEVVTRRQALLGWRDRMERETLLSQPLRLADLFAPRTFLNALRQQTARLCSRAIDSLKLVCSWDPALLARSAKLPINVEGLLIQGCGFSANMLSPLTADSPSVSRLPAVTIAFIPKEETDPYPAERSLSLPVYLSLSREEMVCELKLPCRPDEQTRWILSGAAIFLTEAK